jgi:hypothetical protein
MIWIACLGSFIHASQFVLRQHADVDRASDIEMQNQGGPETGVVRLAILIVEDEALVRLDAVECERSCGLFAEWITAEPGNFFAGINSNNRISRPGTKGRNAALAGQDPMDRGGSNQRSCQ